MTEQNVITHIPCFSISFFFLGLAVTISWRMNLAYFLGDVGIFCCWPHFFWKYRTLLASFNFFRCSSDNFAICFLLVSLQISLCSLISARVLGGISASNRRSLRFRIRNFAFSLYLKFWKAICYNGYKIQVRTRNNLSATAIWSPLQISRWMITPLNPHTKSRTLIQNGNENCAWILM